MPTGPSILSRFIRKLAAPRTGDEQTDGALLERFMVVRDESAFATLVHRHGPMVLAVCRSILNDANDAEDAFQATFLVLVRKARSIGKPESLGSWLYGVAYRIALKARGAAARRRTHESQAPAMSSVNPEQAMWHDLQPLLHEEVNRLPERYRQPFVLCYFEGRSNAEAAQILGWPKGTVLSSLARARDRLRERLTRRGVALSTAVLTTLLAQQTAPAAVPVALVETTVRSAVSYVSGAAAGLSASVLTHTNDMLRGMVRARVKLLGAAVLLIGAMVALGLAAYQAWTADRAVRPQPPVVAEVQTKPLPEDVPVRPDHELVRGAWVVVGGEQAGQSIDQFVKGDRLTFTRDDFSMNAAKDGGSRLFRRGTTIGRFRLDPNSQPRRIEFIEKTRTLEGIYLVTGDTLKICLCPPEERKLPSAFATTADDRCTLLLLKRP